MTERLATWTPQDDNFSLSSRGIPTDELITVYRRWGQGGFGVILTGNIMIDPSHLEATGNLVIPPNAPFSGERFEKFQELARECKKHGSLMIGQVSHPGRQVGDHIQKNPISASDVQLEGKVLGFTYAKPRPMKEEDFASVVEGFAHAAEYLYKAGFDGVQLHAAQ